MMRGSGKSDKGQAAAGRRPVAERKVAAEAAQRKRGKFARPTGCQGTSAICLGATEAAW